MIKYFKSFLTVALLAAFVVISTSCQLNPKDITSRCPFTLSDNAEWTFYPNDNFMGLVAMGSDLDEADQTYILVFEKKAMDEYAEQVLTKGSVSSNCYYGSLDYEDKEIKEKSGCIYAKLKCDNRIRVVNFCFSYFDEDIDESEIITIDSYANSGEGEKMELLFVHYDYGDPQQTDDIKKTQVYDLDKGKWDEIIETEIQPIEHSEGVYFDVRTELQVDPQQFACDYLERENNTEYMIVAGYDYLRPTYNIYQELDSPEEVRLKILIGTTDQTPLKDAVDPNKFFKDSDIKLYVKSGDKYEDITPDTVWTEYEGDGWGWNNDDESNIEDHWYFVCFQGLGELEEGNYKLVIGDYEYDFKLTVQPTVVC